MTPAMISTTTDGTRHRGPNPNNSGTPTAIEKTMSRLSKDTSGMIFRSPMIDPKRFRAAARAT
jgi:hypothetical protein